MLCRLKFTPSASWCRIRRRALLCSSTSMYHNCMCCRETFSVTLGIRLGIISTGWSLQSLVRVHNCLIGMNVDNSYTARSQACILCPSGSVYLEHFTHMYAICYKHSRVCAEGYDWGVHECTACSHARNCNITTW